MHQAAGEVVDEWVETAVGAGQGQHYWVQSIGGPSQATAGQQAHVGQGVAQQVEVVGDKAEQEDPQHPVDEGEGALAAAVLRAGAVSRLTPCTRHRAVRIKERWLWDDGSRRQDWWWWAAPDPSAQQPLHTACKVVSSEDLLWQHNGLQPCRPGKRSTTSVWFVKSMDSFGLSSCGSLLCLPHVWGENEGNMKENRAEYHTEQVYYIFN